MRAAVLGGTDAGELARWDHKTGYAPRALGDWPCLFRRRSVAAHRMLVYGLTVRLGVPADIDWSGAARR